jgi:hypothetical protein
MAEGAMRRHLEGAKKALRFHLEQTKGSHSSIASI